jgi:hypothetical protein
MPRKYTPEERIAAFWAKVNKESGHWWNGIQCWFWIAGGTKAGYGTFSYGGRQIGAHCVSYILANGPIPDGLFVLHRCDNPACVNPDHLYVGTSKENTHDMMAKGRDQFTYRVQPERVPRGDDHYTRRNPELARHGEQLGHSKLTDELVREMRRKYAEGGATQYALAAEFNVSVATVNRVVKRRLWQHVE